LVRPGRVIRLMYPGVIWRGNKTDRSVFLTFDDGPIPDVTPWVLNLLDQFDAKATFFCVGQNVERYPDIFQMITHKGHLTGNHTFNHIVEWHNEWNVYQDNIDKAQLLIQSSLFRPPHGKIRPWRISRLKKQFKQVVMWDVLSCDYDQSLHHEVIYHNVIDNVRNGSVIVFHDSVKAWPHLQIVLPKVLEWLQKNNYQFKLIDE
jgi:peptidoglycan-N-acetylglucosamine deacetylase